MTVPRRHWRSYGNDPLPTPAEALKEPFAAFPSWFLRIVHRGRQQPTGAADRAALMPGSSGVTPGR
jgi:hypothetical protein